MVSVDEQAIVETTPLSNTSKKITPLPKLQLTILLILLLAEPITSTIIYPFINQLVNDLGVTHGDERKTGYYVGFIESFFFLIEGLLVLQWGRLSDKIGRKPVLLIGLFGGALSMICFGLSKTFGMLLLSRGLEGALNGNVGVIKSMLGEITDETNMAQAFAFIPICWAAGSTIGPMLGGFLSRPAPVPSLLAWRSFLQRYPYFLPCFAAATYSTFAFVMTALLLKETHASGRFSSTTVEDGLRDGLLDVDEEVPGPETPLLRRQRKQLKQTTPSLHSLIINSRVRTAILNYSILALLDIAFVVLQPLILSTPISSGGLGLSPPQIGVIMGVFGLVDGLIEIVCFAPLCRMVSTKKVYLMGIASFPFAIASFPIMNFFARRDGLSINVWLVMGLQLFILILNGMAFACVSMFVTSSAPTTASLGATNGLAQTATAFMRAVGPACATSLFALSVEKNLEGGRLVYWVLISLTVVALAASRDLPDEPWRMQEMDSERCC